MSKEANQKMDDVEKKVAQSAATFLGTQMEIWDNFGEQRNKRKIYW